MGAFFDMVKMRVQYIPQECIVCVAATRARNFSVVALKLRLFNLNKRSTPETP